MPGTIRSIAAAGVAVSFAVLQSCAINPATGKRQFMLVSESQEIAMGRESDHSITAQFGVYDDAELEQYVARIGQELVATSERPDLDWHFRVLDDPLVNAFALPGGYIYVTRGILAHFNSEAEMASVIGHEIGHVTARHSASQISKAQLAQLGLGVATVLGPEEVQEFGGLATQGLGLLFLKFGRDDERQADDLGLRYMVRADYDPRPMAEVFRTLERVSASSGQGRVPGWASTHPDPQNRQERVDAAVAAMGREASTGAIRREEFLDKIDGVVFGHDPRHGFFDDAVFYHPEMRFEIRFPQGWETLNTRQFVMARSPREDAQIQLSLSSKSSAAEAAREFFGKGGVTRVSDGWSRTVNGLQTSGGNFQVQMQNGVARGQVVFVEHDNKVFEILGLTIHSAWDGYREAVTGTLASFDRLTDPRLLDVEPKRIDIVRIDRAMSVEAFAERYNATVDAKTLALINGLDPGARLEASRSYKVVRGGELP